MGGLGGGVHRRRRRERRRARVGGVESLVDNLASASATLRRLLRARPRGAASDGSKYAQRRQSRAAALAAHGF